MIYLLNVQRNQLRNSNINMDTAKQLIVREEISSSNGQELLMFRLHDAEKINNILHGVKHKYFNQLL